MSESSSLSLGVTAEGSSREVRSEAVGVLLSDGSPARDLPIARGVADGREPVAAGVLLDALAAGELEPLELGVLGGELEEHADAAIGQARALAHVDALEGGAANEALEGMRG